VVLWKSEEKEVHIPNTTSFNPTLLIWTQDQTSEKRRTPVLDPKQSLLISSSQDGPPATKFRRISVFDRLNYKVQDSQREPKRISVFDQLKTVEKTVYGQITKKKRGSYVGYCHRAWKP